MALMGDVLDWLRKLHANFKVRNPRRYWERRHAIHGDELTGVGHHRLSLAENKLDYAQKSKEIGETISAVFPARSDRRNALDAGCGVGVFTELLVEFGFETVAVDFSAQAIERAKRRVPEATFKVGGLEDLSGFGRFQLITCIDVLFHVLNQHQWASIVENLSTLLSEDGVLLIQEHLVTDAQYEGRRGHAHFRRMRDYDELFETVGLHVQSHSKYQLPAEGTWKDLLVLSSRCDEMQ